MVMMVLSFRQLILSSLLALMFISRGTLARTLQKQSAPSQTKEVLVLQKEVGGQFAFSVSIQHYSSNAYTTQYVHLCGGMILDSQTILTASHCFDNIDQQRCPDEHAEWCYRVVAGEINYEMRFTSDEVTQTRVFPASAATRHDGYDGFHYFNDIALIRLSKPLNFTSNIKPVRLASPTTAYNRKRVLIGGWRTVSRYPSSGEVAIPRKIKGHILSEEECFTEWGEAYHPDVMLCTNNYNEVPDICKDKSDGILVAQGLHDKRHYAVGILSWGFDCNAHNYPAIYTRIDAYLPWIESVRRRAGADGCQ